MPFSTQTKWPRQTLVPGKDVYLEDRPLASLQIDHSFQRKRDDWFCRRLESEWDESALGIFTISARETGEAIILDGQHRQPVALAQGVRFVTCVTHYHLTHEEEAQLFVKHNPMHTIRAPELFAAQVVGGDPIACGVQELVEAAGCFIVRDPNELRGGRQIIAVKTLQVLYQTIGPEVLSYALQIINTAWPTDPEALQKNALRGVAHFIAIFRHTKGFTEKRLIDMLRKTSPMALVGQANRWEETYRTHKGDSLVHALTIFWNSEHPGARFSEERILPLSSLVRDETESEVITIARVG